MLNLDAFHISELPYIALPENAHRAAIDSISKQGFTSLEEYSFFSLGENQPVKTNILAFAHPIHRTPEYTGLTVFNAVNGHNDGELVRLLATSAAPFHLIHRDGEFSFWTCPIVAEEPEPVVEEKHISYDQLENVLRKYETDLKPQRIIDVKQGYDTFTYFRNVEPLQLSFWAAEVNGKRLVNHFGSTVGSLRTSINRRTDISQAEKDILVTTLSIQMLGATVLADTGALDIDSFGEKEEIRRNRPSLDKLMLKAARKYERYFRSELFIKYISEAQEAYEILREVCFAGFVPDMLRELYKAAYSEQERKESGSYDTPLYLTRQIWKNIPVEYLPPQKRIVVDMTCGWGSFLVAGHERLSNLKDMEDIVLRNQLYGNDNSNFTAQLAGLGLLLSTSEDSWNIHHGDALEWQWLQTQQPTIIVGNPPFGGNRKEASESSTQSSVDKTREEKANSFLEHAINRLAPGGYLAMIMPRSFTVAEASPKLRQKLLKECDVLELWELPTKVFSGPMQRTIVVFAQKSAKSQGRLQTPVRTRTIQTRTLDTFKLKGVVTSSGLVINQGMWNKEARKSPGSENDHLIDYSLILPEYTWHTIQKHCNNLVVYAEIIRGAGKGKKQENKRWTHHPEPKLVPWLEGVKVTMPASYPFFIDYSEAKTIIYPNDLEEPRKSKNPARDKEYLLAGTKVLIPYDVEPSWGKKVRVAIERKGYYVSDHFYVVAPKLTAKTGNITHEVLAAVLNWDVSNAWIIEHLKSMGIPIRTMNDIPFPKELSVEDCNKLTQAMLQLEDAAYANHTEPIEAVQIIDSILKRAYHLDDATFARLRQVREWNNRSQISLDPQPYSDDANCFINGVVDSIDPDKGTITLWIKDFDDLQTVQIVPSMPGWMLRPDTAFRTEIPYGYLKRGIIDPTTNSWGAFRPQPYTYMSEEELLEGFADLLNNRVG